MPVEISNIAEKDIPGAVDCIQRAFKEDPYSKFVFDTAKFSKKRNAVSLGIRCRWGMQHGIFHVAKDTDDEEGKVLGVACWLRPFKKNTPQTWKAWYGDWWLWVEQVKMNLWHGRGGLIVKRYWIWKEAQTKAQSEIWTAEDGMYFCNIVTVVPEAQGQGIGKLLFKAVTDQADREGKLCYLESSRAVPNMAIYEKMGFKLDKEMLLEDQGDAVKLYCMTREPVQV
ncbi:Hypothetical protein R9X50_00264200 [Acrodontium crateriforme]|uniref:N-acetyltransferase domain-containing protein n=1 Tax=Acrodontium crateriforme TaxID=150365 RepID=A0AAQ3M1F1_9PEZI|nr:Hypothetical protein R9X50_00264200 [Acrodontium crateriforme]